MGTYSTDDFERDAGVLSGGTTMVADFAFAQPRQGLHDAAWGQ
jgi:hypothetical protein